MSRDERGDGCNPRPTLVHQPWCDAVVHTMSYCVSPFVTCSADELQVICDDTKAFFPWVGSACVCQKSAAPILDLEHTLGRPHHLFHAHVWRCFPRTGAGRVASFGQAVR